MAITASDRAVTRLEAALVEQDRLSERFFAAIGTTTEFAAYIRLKGAGDRVSARAAWVNGSRRRATED